MGRRRNLSSKIKSKWVKSPLDLWMFNMLWNIFFNFLQLKRSQVLGPLQNRMISSTCYINIHFTSTVSEMLQLWACCTRADSSVLCVHIPLAKQNTVSHCKRTTVLFSTWALLKLRHFFLFFPSTTLKHGCFLLKSPWRCKQRSIFSTAADSLRCGVSVNQACCSNCCLRKTDHKILLAMTLKMIELKWSTMRQVWKMIFFRPKNMSDRWMGWYSVPLVANFSRISVSLDSDESPKVSSG